MSTFLSLACRFGYRSVHRRRITDELCPSSRSPDSFWELLSNVVEIPPSIRFTGSLHPPAQVCGHGWIRTLMSLKRLKIAEPTGSGWNSAWPWHKFVQPSNKAYIIKNASIPEPLIGS